MPSSDPLEELLLVIRQGLAASFTGTAFVMLLLYDHAITLDDEIERIWPLPWRLPKILFLVNRYLVAPSVLVAAVFATSDKCVFFLRWLAFSITLAIVVVELMLMLRVLALYCNQRMVLILLSALFIFNMAGFLAVELLIISGAKELKGVFQGKGCVYIAPSFSYAEWIPLVLFESVIVIMTLYKAMPYRRSIPAVRVLARDSMIYFSIMASFLIANLLFSRLAKGFLGGLWVMPSNIVACIAVARMTLNIREFSCEGKPLGDQDILSTEKFQTTGFDTTIALSEIPQLDMAGENVYHESNEQNTEVR